MACSSSCDHPPSEIEPYEDIAGIGVILSFLLSAFMLVAFVTIYYLGVYDPDLDPYRTTGEPHLRSKNPNPIDRTFLRIVRRLPGLLPSKFVESGALESALIRSTRTFSDIQICTGIAILISGFRAYSCDLQSYHWQLIVYMAWLACLTHTSVLSFLRNYLLNHRRQLWWRFGGTSVIAAMLLVAFGLTFDFEWQGNQTSNFARCPGTEAAARDAFETKLKLGFFLVYGYVIRVLKLVRVFDNTPRLLSLWLRQKSIGIQDKGSEGLGWDPHSRSADRRKIRFINPIKIAFCQVAHIHLDLQTSFLGEVFWLIVSFVWATRRLLTIRTAVGVAAENMWTFGQIIPLVLLAAPLVALIDHFSPKSQVPADYDLSLGQETHQLTYRGEQPVLSSDRQVVDEQKQVDYESSITFLGASVIAGFTYVHVATFVLASDNVSRSIAYTVGSLAFSCLVFQPPLQMTWVIYALWIPKLKLVEHRIAPLLDMIFLAIYTVLAAHTSSEIASGAGDNRDKDYIAEAHILGEAITIVCLLFAYLGFLVWFTWDSHIRMHFRDSNEPRKVVYLRCVIITCSILTSIAENIPAVIIGTIEGINGLDSWIGFITGIVLACQIMIEMVELGIQRWTRTYSSPIRFTFLAIITLIAVGTLYSLVFVLPYFSVPGMMWLLPMFITCPFWVTFWTLYYMIIKRD